MANITSSEKELRRTQILGALPAEQIDLVAATGLSKATVSRWIARLHELKEIHVGSWRRNPNGGDFIPTYAAGAGDDAPCSLIPLSNTERHRRMRERKREASAAATWADVWSRLESNHHQSTQDQPCLATS